MQNFNKKYLGHGIRYDFLALLRWIDIHETELKNKTTQNKAKQKREDL